MPFSAQDDLVPALVDAVSSAFEHHGGRLDPGCLGCFAAAEGSFSKAMMAWERFLFDCLVALVGGERTRHADCARISRRVAPKTGSNPEALVLRSRLSGGLVTLSASPRNYLLLHEPTVTIAIVDFFVDNSHLSETIDNHQDDIRRTLALRHGVSHGTGDAQRNLRAALIHWEPLKLYRSLGEFLVSRSAPGRPTYLEDRIGDLYGWATSIAP